MVAIEKLIPTIRLEVHRPWMGYYDVLVWDNVKWGELETHVLGDSSAVILPPDDEYDLEFRGRRDDLGIKTDWYDDPFAAAEELVRRVHACHSERRKA